MPGGSHEPSNPPDRRKYAEENMADFVDQMVPVVELVERARADERERCAKIVEGEIYKHRYRTWHLVAEHLRIGSGPRAAPCWLEKVTDDDEATNARPEHDFIARSGAARPALGS